VRTDPFGTVSVHWGEIETVARPRKFGVQMETDEHYFASLAAASRGQMVLEVDGGASVAVVLVDVIRLAPSGARGGTESTAASTPASASRRDSWKCTAHEQFSAEPASRVGGSRPGRTIRFLYAGDGGLHDHQQRVRYLNSSGRNRVRLDLQTAWRHVPEGFLLEPERLRQLRRRSAPADQKTNDFGVSFSLGWKF
jgi:hypothetical protein